jgi:hypothetical protein
VKYKFVLKNKGAFYRIPKGGRPRDLRPDLYVAFVEEDGEEADGEDQRPRPDAQGHRQVHTHLLQEHTHTFEQTALGYTLGYNDFNNFIGLTGNGTYGLQNVLM